MKHKLVIKPAIPPEHRHKIEKLLKKMGYDWYGGGTNVDLSSCDISFDGNPKENPKHRFGMKKE